MDPNRKRRVNGRPTSPSLVVSAPQAPRNPRIVYLGRDTVCRDGGPLYKQTFKAKWLNFEDHWQNRVLPSKESMIEVQKEMSEFDCQLFTVDSRDPANQFVVQRPVKRKLLWTSSLGFRNIFADTKEYGNANAFFLEDMDSPTIGRVVKFMEKGEVSDNAKHWADFFRMLVTMQVGRVFPNEFEYSVEFLSENVRTKEVEQVVYSSVLWTTVRERGKPMGTEDLKKYKKDRNQRAEQGKGKKELCAGPVSCLDTGVEVTGRVKSGTAMETGKPEGGKKKQKRKEKLVVREEPEENPGVPEDRIKRIKVATN